ncbi:hypothetical protein C2G38_2194068 [Gigaspora rosea]|uniref:BTB domain-containing protein n=1 Tax=Gigaspora rosea TaxID=44941 RepID=A0A397UZG4_9GLOM|nr:hypothetical protein C2G38_2194068 [Gigaspora rosea]
MSQISTKLLVRFSNDFAQLLESEYDYNVIVKLGQQSFKLHSLVLYQHSSFVRQELATATKKNNIIEITLMILLLKYIYTGTILLDNDKESTIFDLLVPSNKLGLTELVEYIQSFLIDNKASWLKLKLAKVYSTKNALINLLKRDDLQIEESKIWDKVIQWEKEQTPDLPSDLKQWTENNFLDLKTTLDQCIPLIRYFQMSGKDIVAKVKPYRQILGLNLWDDISTKTMDPDASISSTILPARKKIHVQLPVREIQFINPSSIITDEHFAEITSWIDRHSSIYGVAKIPYKFNLLLRGCRDGFTREIFHRSCDNIPGTVTIIKVNVTNEILGGYNPLVWVSNDQFKCRIIHAKKVIGCAKNFGPGFGNYFFMKNYSKKWAYMHNDAHYEKRLRSDDNNLLIDEFEIFQVLKN